jgi:hypothetical protein
MHHSNWVPLIQIPEGVHSNYAGGRACSHSLAQSEPDASCKLKAAQSIHAGISVSSTFHVHRDTARCTDTLC